MADFTEIRNEFQDVSAFLVAIGDETRQRIILRLLEETSCEGLRVNDLKEATGLSRPAISHHLKLLKDAHIVNYKTVGNKNYYYFTHDIEEIEKAQHFLGNVKKAMEGKEKK